MDIQEQFCPRCGGPTSGGICNRCKVETTQWLVCERRVEVTRCSTCGSLKQGNTWTDAIREQDDLAAELAMTAVHIHDDVHDAHFEIDIRSPSPNRTVCTVFVTGTLYSLPVEGECSVEIAWKKEQCDRCSRYSGGYFEAILQVRATERKPSVYEIERAVSAAYSSETQLQEGGDRLSFILKIDENRDGVDIVVGSHHLGETIAREIVKDLGGRYTTHPKLVGEKDGKQLYRVNYSIRLPRYQKGDIIFLDRRYYEVRSMDSHGLKVFDLTEGAYKVLREDTVGRLIGNVRDTKDALVAYIHNDIAGILDPDTYETVEIIVYAWLPLTEGGQVRVLRDTEAEKLICIG